MKKRYSIFLLSICCFYNATAQVPNNFKIGFLGDSWTSINPNDTYNTLVTTKYKPSPNNTYYSSAMGIFSEDGFNFMRTYHPDIYISQNNYKKYIELCGNNSFTMIDGQEGWFKSKPNDPDGILGTNVYDMSSMNPSPAYNNYDALYTNVYNILPYKNYVFGHVISGESNYNHWRVHEGVFPASDFINDPNSWSQSDVSPQKISEAMGHFYPYSSAGGQNLLQVQAYHSGSVSNDP